jgi:hypothetical protein
MKWNNQGASSLPGGGLFGIPPMFLLIGILIIVVLLFTGFLAVIFAAKTLIVIALVGVGIYLLIKPAILATAGPIAKYLIPFALIVLGIAFYSGWLSL